MGAAKLAPDESIDDRVGKKHFDDAMSWLGSSRLKHQALLSYVCSLAAIGVSTWLAFQLEFHPASIGFIYLIVVVVTAAYGDFLQATLVSVAAVACLDFFFFRPSFASLLTIRKIGWFWAPLSLQL